MPYEAHRKHGHQLTVEQDRTYRMQSGRKILIVQATRYFSWTDDRQRIFLTREKHAKKKLSLLPSRKINEPTLRLMILYPTPDTEMADFVRQGNGVTDYKLCFFFVSRGYYGINGG
jgi:hypothetical protein